MYYFSRQSSGWVRFRANVFLVQTSQSFPHALVPLGQNWVFHDSIMGVAYQIVKVPSEDAKLVLLTIK